MDHIVRQIKTYNHVTVANAMFALGWRWHNPKRRPTNVERMVEGLPRHELLRLHSYLQETSTRSFISNISSSTLPKLVDIASIL